MFVNGDREIVEAICDHPGIEAVFICRSTKVAKIVYKRSTFKSEKMRCIGWRKNHLIVMPDAHPDMTASNVTASMSGCAGQRCMAASAMVAVGQIDFIINKICDEAKKIIPGKNLGSVNQQRSERKNLNATSSEAEKAGAKSFG